ncbi:GGDEF domain-containing protein [Budviciaceae bacterium CWB-B4]|uniref:diguanylate cyclase n=1 Tax=Limnobaculum xujianqingii TaxID=2738837 RepID=A0A9D7AGE1_9GAMM|nr:GGDEF domain-containing protein [Limnobaculum xujianqingii]MBK5072295.1 GGDEF domain-containing protein [Limnobaculum xujianqingii]MBK5175604.1 GGDEF domain-containing protein [Limnobaculum xujianqingii]
MMKIRNFFIFIILFIITSLSILSVSTISGDLSDLRANIKEQNKIKYLQLLLIAGERIYDEHQTSKMASFYQIAGPINYHPVNTAINNLLEFTEQEPKKNEFPHDKYAALEVNRLSEEIRKDKRFASSYSFNRLESIIEYQIIQIQNHSAEFMIAIEGVRLTTQLYSFFTELIDQLIDIEVSHSMDESSAIKAIKLLGAIDETESRLVSIQKNYLKHSNKSEEIDTLVSEVFSHDTIKINHLIYNNFDHTDSNDIGLQRVNHSYFQAKDHLSALNKILLSEAIEISANQIYLSRIKIYSMVCFLAIFFLFAILPISVMIFKLSGAFTLVQKAVTQLSNNDLNINFNENQSRFSFELESIIQSLTKLKKIQIEKYRLENRNKELIRKLQLSATTDYLTGISNRRAFLDAIRYLPAEQQYKASLALIDIDNFKRINDRFGHSCGDEVLMKFSRLLKAFFRKEDLFCRYGGEEFAILLYDCDNQQAQKTLERLCKKTRYLSVIVPESEKEKVYFTISIGTTELADRSSINHAINRADKALYHAKTTGKDRVVTYAPQIEVPTE